MRFNIDGVWYNANTYKEAREQHDKAKAGQAKTAQINKPNVVVKPAVVQNTQPILKQNALKHTVPISPKVPIPGVNAAPAFSLPKKKVAPLQVEFVYHKKSTPSADSFDLVVYRGEKNQWWPAPEKRMVSGMTLYDPWNTLPPVKSMTDLWTHMQSFIHANSVGNVAAFCQHLRATSRAYALATAWTEKGSFTSDYNYVIKIPNVRTFLWGPNLTLGAPAGFKKPADVTAPFIVLDADTIAQSSILGVGHEAGTFEITFMHDLRKTYVESCNQKAVTTTPVDEWSFDEKARLMKLVRYEWPNWL